MRFRVSQGAAQRSSRALMAPDHAHAPSARASQACATRAAGARCAARAAPPATTTRRAARVVAAAGASSSR